MGQQLRTLAARQPGRALAALAAIAVLCGALAAGETERLALAGSETEHPALTIRLRGAQPARSAAHRVVVRTMRSQLSADPTVASIRELSVAGDRRATTLVVRFSVSGKERDSAVSRIERNLDPGPLAVAFGGQTAVLRAARDGVVDDLVLLLLAAPVAALILVASMGLRPAAATGLAAAAATAGAALASELLGGLLDLSLLALVGAGSGGILVSLQLCALARRGAPASLLGAVGIASAAVFACLGLLGVDYLGSVGLGGAVGALLAVPASLVAIAAAEAWGGDTGVRRLMPARSEGLWRGLEALLGWSGPAAAAIAVLAAGVMLTLALPVTGLRIAALASATAPAIGTGGLGVAVGGAVAITAVLCWAVSRRPLLALAATVAMSLPVMAAAGVGVLSIQDGRLEGLLDYSSAGVFHLGSVGAALAAVSAVAAAHAVSFSWAAEAAPGTLRNGHSALPASGAAAAIVCSIGVAAGAALVGSSLVFVKEFGIALAAGLLLELLLVQALLAPALLSLLDRRGQ